MKKFCFFTLLFFGLYGTANAGVHYDTQAGGGWCPAGDCISHLYLDDNLNLYLGSAPDYWWTYDSTNTALKLVSTDVDGGGTDGVVAWVNDGQPYFYIGTLSQGIRLDASANGILSCYDEAGSNCTINSRYFTLGGSHSIQGAAGTALLMRSDGGKGFTFYTNGTDFSAANDIVFKLMMDASDNAELTASSGTQYYLKAIGEVAQTGTAGYEGIHLDITQTSVGSGTSHLLNLGVGGSSKITVDNAGDTVITGTLKTEVVTADAPAEPHACDAAHSGVIVTVDDTNDTAYNEPCVCLNLDGTGYDWRQLNDVTGTACPYF